MILISKQAQLQADGEVALKQAKSASAVASSLMNASDGNKASRGASTSGGATGDAQRERHEKEVKKLQQELSESREEVIKLRLNCDSIKKQATSVSSEYDRLMKEHEGLQRKFEAAGTGGDNRKDR